MGAKKVKPVLSFYESIRGEKWKISFYPKAQFVNAFGNCVGVTVYHHKTGYRAINLMTSRLNKDTIAHEIMHAILSYRDFSCCSYGTIEEHVCEDIGRYHARILALTNKIYNKYKKRKKC